MAMYKYKALSSSRSVRMLRLDEVKGGFRSPIFCTLEEVDLDELHLQFLALSYVWGNPGKLASIFVEGKTLEVGENLRNALLRLRTNTLFCCNLTCACYCETPGPPVPLGYQFTSPLRLWIDSICINQKDAIEKAKQVGLMKDVYRRASRVIVWLGEESEHTVPGFRMLHGISSLYDLDVAKAKDLVYSLVLDDHFRSYWIALGNLLLRPWWYRIWAVQEICLAREALLVCGQYAVDWDHIQKSAAALFVCMDAIDELTEATVLSNPEVGSAFEGFARGMSRLKLFRLLRFSMDRKQSSNENAYALLGVAQNSLSSNPRDRIYGMRGLAEELCWNSQFATIPVDYDISVCDLFMRTTQALYSATGEVSFLDEIERTTIKGGKRNFDLPSWVPDWTLPTSYGQPLRDDVRNSINRRLPKDNQVFSTTCRGKAVCSFDLTSKKATIQGFMVDSIRQLETRLIDLSPSVRVQNAQRFVPRLCWKLPPESDLQERYLYWTSFLGPQFSPKLRVEPGGPGRESSDTERSEVHTLAFATEKQNLIGSTDGAAAVNDIVCWFLGGRVPYILRQQGDCWQYVGQA